MLKEFKNFAIKGNVIDMAVGGIIGTAFGKIVSSLVTDIIMPPLGWITGGVDFSNLKITLKEGTETAQTVSINYGAFINNIINFIIIAFSIFIAIKQMNRLRDKIGKKDEAATGKDGQTVKASEEVSLLREIRDQLKSLKK